MMSSALVSVPLCTAHTTSSKYNELILNILNAEPVWKVARYTTAAPLIFNEVDNYVDGSILASNPCEYGISAINNFFRCSK